MKRAVFFDRDGTLMREKEYLCRPDDVEIFPGVVSALGRLSDAGFQLFIVTNQSGVGRGYFTMEDVGKVHARLLEGLAGARFERVYIAPEAPGQPSRGRKPSPAFLFDARDEFGLDLGGSYVVGDKLLDLECGWNANVRRSILVRTGYGKQVEASGVVPPGRAVIVDDLAAAADWILADG